MDLSKIKLSWILIGGLVVYILYLQQCSGPKGDSPGNDLDTLSFTTDTIHITTVDTVRFSDTVIRYISLDIPVAEIIPHPTGKDSVHKYTTPVSDSLLEGTIVSTVEGVLLDQTFQYIPKFPKYIIKRDSVFVKNDLVVEKKRNFLFVGGELGGNLDRANVSPIVGLHTKKGFAYSYRYGLLDKTHNFTMTKKLNFKFKN